MASVGLSLALLGLLIAAGVQMLRGRPSGRTLHLWWAWAKLAAAVFGTVAWVYLFRSLFGAFGTTGVRPALSVTWFPLVGLALAAAWPITVLCLLRRGDVRRYFEVG